MKKTAIMLASAVLALGLVVSSCADPTKDQTEAAATTNGYTEAAAPTEVKATIVKGTPVTADGTTSQMWGVVVTWKGTASQHTVYCRQEGKTPVDLPSIKLPESPGDSGTLMFIPSNTMTTPEYVTDDTAGIKVKDGTYVVKDTADTESWVAHSAVGYSTGGFNYGLPKGTYEFGVQANPLPTDALTTISSDIVWAFEKMIVD